MEVNQENEIVNYDPIREFHLWDFPDNLFILFNKEANDQYFKKMYDMFGTQQKFADFLCMYRQEINKYH